MSVDEQSKQINNYLNRYHINHSHLGYTYLMTGIRALLNEQVPRGQAQELYRMIAAEHETNARLVDDAIRRSLEGAKVNMKNKEFLVTARDELIFGWNPSGNNPL